MSTTVFTPNIYNNYVRGILSSCIAGDVDSFEFNIMRSTDVYNDCKCSVFIAIDKEQFDIIKFVTNNFNNIIVDNIFTYITRCVMSGKIEFAKYFLNLIDKNNIKPGYLGMWKSLSKQNNNQDMLSLFESMS